MGFPRYLLSLFVFALAFCARAEDDAVRVEIGTDREFYLQEAHSTVCLELRLTGRAASEPTAAQNVVLVFDRSGSMAGEAMQALREAALEVARSAGPHDASSVVFFASEVDAAIELGGDLATLEGRLSAIEAEGGSATYDALNQAAAQLRRTAQPGRRNHLVLLTDGPATKGPRDEQDFVRLADAFAAEGISISTIGLGPDFDEDVLAAIARQGKGTFQYARDVSRIRDAVAVELRSSRSVVARSVEVKLEFPRDARRIEPYGSVPHAFAEQTVTWRLPIVYAEERRSLLASASVMMGRTETTVATFSIKWIDAATGRERSASRKITVQLDGDDTAVRRSRNVEVLRSVAGAIVTEGMQEAIERIDKGDFRGALRRLRRARTDIDFMNYGFDDPEISRRVAQLDAYLGDVSARGFNQLDRKVLRSGLDNQFDRPSEEESPRR